LLFYQLNSITILPFFQYHKISSVKSQWCSQNDSFGYLFQNTPFISNLQKDFYKTMLQERKERILDFSYKKLLKREQNRDYER